MTRRRTSLVLGYPSCVAELVATELLDAGHTVYLLLAQETFGKAAALKKKYGKMLQLSVGKGDQLDFGLSGKEYLKIANEVQTIYVLYAEGDHQKQESFNGALVRELVAFCDVAPKIKRVLLLSDFFFADGFTGVVAERDIDVPMAGAADRQSLVRVENVLRRFQQKIPLTTVRTGTMVGTEETLFPVVMLALGHPELFAKSNISMFLADVAWVARCIVEIAEKSEPGLAFHLFQKSFSPRSLGAKLMQMAMAQLPRTYDVRLAARKYLRQTHVIPRTLPDAQIEAKIENSWTKGYFRAHNFSNWETELNWQPLIENEVEKLTGFR